MLQFSFNTCEDSGCLPIIAPVTELNEGDVIEIYPFKGEIHKNGAVVSKFDFKPTTLADEIRAVAESISLLEEDLLQKQEKH